MPNQVLVFSRFPRRLVEMLGQHFEMLDTQGRPPAEVFAPEVLGQVTALLTAGAQTLDGAAMDQMPKLRAIICYGTGYDGVDLAAARTRGIAVGNSPAANASAVADLAMALLLAAARRIVPADDYVRSGRWMEAAPSPLLSAPQGLTGARLGIYGMGEIGRRIAHRAAAFEMDVAYHSRSRHDVPAAYFDTLAALADWSDHLVIAVRAGADTRHAVDRSIIDRIGSHGILVNIARGSVVDEGELVLALKEGRLGAAGLDVFASEPCPPAVFAGLANTVLAPHIGGHTMQSHAAMQACIIANLSAFFAGRPLAYPVSG